MIPADAAGPPLAQCFDLARAAGATQAQLAVVRNETLAEAPTLIGAVIFRDSIVQLCLANEGLVISGMTFTSRQDVEALMLEENNVFAPVEEEAADAMDQMTYRGLISLHAAISYYLTAVARPMPRMVSFAFWKSQATLVAAMKLYYDASRADELRAENKVVHPAFMKPTGRALSA